MSIYKRINDDGVIILACSMSIAQFIQTVRRVSEGSGGSCRDVIDFGDQGGAVENSSELLGYCILRLKQQTSDIILKSQLAGGQTGGR